MESSISLTPAKIKGLAHPLRVAMLALLRTEGPATATQLASLLETTSGATSYHLRELAKHGFIATKPDAGSGRERYWEANHLYTILERSDLADDPEALALYDEFVRLGSVRRESEVLEWVSSQEEWGPEWASAVALDDHLLTVSASELSDLHDRVSGLISELVERPEAEAPEGAVQVVVHLLAFPVGSLRSRSLEIAKEAEGLG